MSNKYYETCWECRHLASSPNWRNDDVNGSRREIRCNALHYGVNPFDHKCSRFDNGHYGDDYIQRCVDAFYKKCNYYIVSACVNITGAENASAYLDAFENVSKEGINAEQVVSVLSKIGLTPESLLADYDVYGKAVADALYASFENPESKDATVAFVKSTIMPKLDAMVAKKEEGKVLSTILDYIGLTRNLMTVYGIQYVPSVCQGCTLEEPNAGGRK